MDPAKNNSTLDFSMSNKHKSRVPFSDSASNREGSTHSHSSIGSGSWYDSTTRERREHGKNRDRSHERDKDWNRENRNVNTRTRENYREDETRDRFREEQKTFPAYGYAQTTPDGTFSDSSRRAMGMMTNFSTYGLIAAMNSTQWGMNPLEGMNMNSSNMAVTPAAAAINMNPSMDPNAAAAAASTGLNPFSYMSMTNDPNLFGMMGMGNYGQYGMMGGDPNMMMNQMKDVIHLSHCILYPPNPNAPPPTKREKPPGCKTVFVGGLPENATEDIIREIFERCGEILTVRMSKKNFCHIRFSSEGFIENAIYLSGYRLKIENKDDPPNTGRLHVDYAQARDDQYEYECQQRALQREARHRERLEQEYLRPPTPPPVVHYSDHEAAILGEKLRGEETFQQAVLILITWLERGECNKRNSGFFYSMIQSTNSHVRRLMNEKSKYEDELNKAKLMLKQQMQGILLQFNEISKVFNASSLQKVWDHFTKPQRKNIELWKKQTEEIKNAHIEEVLNDRIEDEMEVSDDEAESNNAKKTAERETVADEFGNKVDANEELDRLREENDSLRCQLEAYQNETMLLRTESEQERDTRDRQMQALRQALQGMQKELLMSSQKHSKDEAELKELRALKQKKTDNHEKEEAAEFNREREERHEDAKKESIEIEVCEEPHREVVANTSSVTSSSSNLLSVTESEARLIGLISTFLNVHPFGASIEYTCSYLHQIDCTIKSRDVETLLRKFPSVFKEESTGIGASLEKKWTFCGFKQSMTLGI